MRLQRVVTRLFSPTSSMRPQRVVTAPPSANFSICGKMRKFITTMRQLLRQLPRAALHEREREEEQNKAEWDGFINWVRQHPVTAERLMRIVDDEQSWDHERREAAGGLSRVAKMVHRNAPMDLQQFYTATDLNRLFDWLKAQRDLKEFGLDIDLSSRPKG